MLLFEGCCNTTSSFMISTKSSSFPKRMLKANFVPLPYFDLTPILPPNALTIFSEITSPRPIPYVFICFVFCKHPNSLNSLTLSFFLIPIPESITWITILSLTSSCSNRVSTLCSCENLEFSLMLLSEPLFELFSELKLSCTFLIFLFGSVLLLGMY